MKSVLAKVIPPNSGRALTVKKGQKIFVMGKTTVDFVAFNLHDTNERFDQARTKVNEGTIFVTTENRLWSQRNNVMFKIIRDDFRGHHDLQKGMCSRQRYQMIRDGIVKRRHLGKEWYPSNRADLPDHGCLENLTSVLKKFKISADNIPSPLNIFQHMVIDPKTGALFHTSTRPKSEVQVVMQAAMDCLVAISACPEGGRGKQVRIKIQ